MVFILLTKYQSFSPLAPLEPVVLAEILAEAGVPGIRDAVRKKRGYVGKIPKLGGGSDPHPLLDVYIPIYFWHAKMILC